MDVYWEVWNQSYDTFGEGSAFIEDRYDSEEAANTAAYCLNLGWGNRAWVERIEDPEVKHATPAEVRERYAYMLPKKLTYREARAIAKGEI